MVKLNENLAEVVGAFIGDGCMSYYKHNKAKTLIMFTGNWKNDVVYYQEVICPTILSEFGEIRSLYHRKDDNTLRYVLHDSATVNFFLELRLPVGLKGERLNIPQEVLADDRLAQACIRGIFNTDGSVYRRYSQKYAYHAKAYRNYAVIQFKMKSLNVISRLKLLLERYGMKVNRITKVLNCSVIRITDQNSVQKFARVIGFTHTYHRKRYLDIVTSAESSEPQD